MDKINLNNHLLYVDVTNQCNLNCEFCMYKNERMQNPLNLKLDKLSKVNISKILNHKETERLIISGEGEPFNNLETIFDLLKLSHGNKKIQIVTNGSWILSNQSDKIINELNNLSNIKEDQYQIRISCDTFHIDKIGKENYKKIINKVFNHSKKETNIEICFRGIFEEKDKVLQMVKDIFSDKTEDIVFNTISDLETDIIIDQKIRLNFIFKNIVNLDDLKNDNTLDKYISSLEKIYNKSFTLGHLKKGTNGMDITIKPNGDIFFYGAEIYSISNIFKEEITIEELSKTINENKILNALYSRPLKELISNFKKDPQFNKIINSVNNPYWIIKKIHNCNKNKFKEILKC